MIWNKHSYIEGRHAFLSPSQYSWTNMSPEQIIKRYDNYRAKEEGTTKHKIAEDCIKMNIKLEGTSALAQHVNDAIENNLKPEQPLYYSDVCFGHADAIGFDGSTLRIQDYKSGQIKAKTTQLKVYAAIFCLEYNVAPKSINIEFGIYQENNMIYESADYEEIYTLMEKIRHDSTLIQIHREERNLV